MTSGPTAPSPTLRLSQYPTECTKAMHVLDSIAQDCGVSPAQLSVMHVSNETAVAALEYSALYARLVSNLERLPLIVDQTKSSNEAYEQDEEHEGDQHVRIPEIEMGNAIVSVTWPPPSELPVKASEANRLFKARHGTGGTPFPVLDAQQQHQSAGVHPTAIYIARYTPDSDDKCKNYIGGGARAILAADAPHDVLRAFVVGLQQWCAMRTAGVQPSGQHFGLYRLRYGSWNRESDRRTRALASVFLPHSMKDDLLRDVRSFFEDETKAWYAKYGVPYRRAYLLHGPPGTGKTSLVRALASEFRRNCCFLSMANSTTSGDELGDAIGQLPPRPLVVIEDVDAVFDAARRSKLSFSALLNILDGIMSSEGVLTIMTTNHPDRLDTAAIRAGRVDRTFHVGLAEDEVIQDCFRAFYKEADDATVKKFSDVIAKASEKQQARSIATLQELFIENRGRSAEDCINATPKFLEQYSERQTFLENAKEKYGNEEDRNKPEHEESHSMDDCEFEE